MSARNGTLLVFGLIALGYIGNLVVFSLPDRSPQQYAAGGLFLIALGAVWAWLVGRPTTLCLDRARNTGRLFVPRFFFVAGTVETFPLDRVRGVRVDAVALSSHDGPPSTYYEVRLETERGRAYRFTLENSRRSAERLARRARAFLKGSGKRLTMRRFPWGMLAVGGAFAVFGALLVLSAFTGWPYPLD